MTDGVAIVGGRVVTGLGEEIESGTVLLSDGRIEAVGAEFWPEYFAVLDRRLAPGGRVALQAITMPHERMRATRSSYTWIQKYIFPGGMIPSLRAVDDLTRTTDRASGLGAATSSRVHPVLGRIALVTGPEGGTFGVAGLPTGWGR